MFRLDQRFSVFLFLGLAIAFLACQQSAENQVLAPHEFDQKLKSTPDRILLDVRTPREVAGGVIEGAQVMDYRSENFKDQLAQLPTGKPVFVYCAAGGRSGKTAKMLQELGYTTVYDLKGGFTAWLAAGLPVKQPE